MINKDVIINRKDEKHNSSTYHEQNSMSDSDNSNSDGESRLFDCWSHKVFNGMREE